MRNYFIKTLLAFIIAILAYFLIDVSAFVRDQRALTALMTFTVLVCMIMYSYYNSNFNRFGNE